MPPKPELPKIKDLIASLKPQGLPSREQIISAVAPKPKVMSNSLPSRTDLLRMLVPGKTITYTAAAQNAAPAPKYDVRGLSLSDDDFTEIRDIMFAEVGNRGGGRRQFEVENIMNVAVNRALAGEKGILDVFQAPNQFQGYAPHGTVKHGKTIESQYQRLKAGKINDLDQEKLKEIETALQGFKTGKFKDRTGGAQYYVHASDGTMWFGQTIAEAKKNALDHEKSTGARASQFGTASGLPAAKR